MSGESVRITSIGSHENLDRSSDEKIGVDARSDPLVTPAPGRDGRHHDSVFTTPGGADVVRAQ